MSSYSLILVLIAFATMYLLYINGYMVVKSKSAVVFMGHMSGGRNSCGFTFTGCDGYVRRVLKVKEKGIRCFDLDSSLSKGRVQFQVMDAKKMPLLTLDAEQTRGRLLLEPKVRYYIQMQFIRASGDCSARWEME